MIIIFFAVPQRESKWAWAELEQQTASYVPRRLLSPLYIWGYYYYYYYYCKPLRLPENIIFIVSRAHIFAGTAVRVSHVAFVQQSTHRENGPRIMFYAIATFKFHKKIFHIRLIQFHMPDTLCATCSAVSCCLFLVFSFLLILFLRQELLVAFAVDVIVIGPNSMALVLFDCSIIRFQVGYCVSGESARRIFLFFFSS